MQAAENDDHAGGAKSIGQLIGFLYLCRIRGNCDDVVIARQFVEFRDVLDFLVVEMDVLAGHAGEREQAETR